MPLAELQMHTWGLDVGADVRRPEGRINIIMRGIPASCLARATKYTSPSKGNKRRGFRNAHPLSFTPAISLANHLLHASRRRLAAICPSSSSPLSSAQQPPSSASAPSSAADPLRRVCLSASASASETSDGLGCAPGSSRKLSHRPHLVGKKHMNSQVNTKKRDPCNPGVWIPWIHKCAPPSMWIHGVDSDCAGYTHTGFQRMNMLTPLAYPRETPPQRSLQSQTRLLPLSQLPRKQRVCVPQVVEVWIVICLALGAAVGPASCAEETPSQGLRTSS